MTRILNRPTRWTRPVASVAAGFLLWISHTLLGLLVVFPVLAALDASRLAQGPDGDALLFRPGGLVFFELLRIAAGELQVASRLTVLLGLLAFLVGLLPLACALDLIWIRESSLAERGLRALRSFPRFLALGVIALLAQGALLLAASILSAAVQGALKSGDERVLSILPLLVFGLGLVGCGAIGCLLDVARAALVQVDYVTREALQHAVLRLRQRPLELLAGGYVSFAAAAFAYSAAAWFTTAHGDLSGSAKLPIVVAFAVHQAAIAFALSFRVRWLTHALELSAEASD